MSQKPRRPNIRSPQPEDGIQHCIVAIDPGKTTGMAVYVPNKSTPAKTVQVFQFTNEEHRTLITRLRRFSPATNPAIIIYEQYVARPSQHGLVGAEAGKALSPVFVHGYVVGAMEQARKPEEMPTIIPQQAS